MVYQEQVMEAARRMAGYTLGGADILRRAMGKKKPEEMAKQREIFVKGAKETNEIDKKKADEIFNIRKIRRLWVQQIPLRGLWDHQLPDRLPEGQSPG